MPLGESNAVNAADRARACSCGIAQFSERARASGSMNGVLHSTAAPSPAFWHALRRAAAGRAEGPGTSMPILRRAIRNFRRQDWTAGSRDRSCEADVLLQRRSSRPAAVACEGDAMKARSRSLESIVDRAAPATSCLRMKKGIP
jgi:hypothetical protein